MILKCLLRGHKKGLQNFRTSRFLPLLSSRDLLTCSSHQWIRKRGFSCEASTSYSEDYCTNHYGVFSHDRLLLLGIRFLGDRWAKGFSRGDKGGGILGSFTIHELTLLLSIAAVLGCSYTVSFGWQFLCGKQKRR